MRILLIHNFYQQFGGEDQVVLQELEALQKNHEVQFYSRHNDDLINLGAMQKMHAAVETIHSRRTISEIEELVERRRPDVAYIHNIYPLVSPSVYQVLSRLRVPIVQVIHDFRPFCANGWFYNQTGVCERCKKGNYLSAVRYKCYKNSRMFSALYAATLSYARASSAVSKVDAFICLTDFARRKLMSAGVPDSKIFVRPNSIDTSGIEAASGGGGYVAFIGRLSREKGIWTLIKAMEQINNVPLKIAGTGPEEQVIREYVESRGLTNVELLGFLSGQARSEFLRNCMFTVLPSEWYEMFPMVLLEAWAHGKAVIGSRLGAIEDLIAEGSNGLLHAAGDSSELADKISRLFGSPDAAARMGAQSRVIVESKYNPALSSALLMDIFQRIQPSGLQTAHVALGTA